MMPISENRSKACLDARAFKACGVVLKVAQASFGSFFPGFAVSVAFKKDPSRLLDVLAQYVENRFVFFQAFF
jgi:hypothetical protein